MKDLRKRLALLLAVTMTLSVVPLTSCDALTGGSSGHHRHDDDEDDDDDNGRDLLAGLRGGDETEESGETSDTEVTDETGEQLPTDYPSPTVSSTPTTTSAPANTEARPPQPYLEEILPQTDGTYVNLGLQWETINDGQTSMHISKPVLMYDSAIRYPALSAALGRYGDELSAAAPSDYSAGQSYLNRNFAVKRSDSTFVSGIDYVTDTFEDTLLMMRGVNFFSATGAEVRIGDIAADPTAMLQTAGLTVRTENEMREASVSFVIEPWGIMFMEPEGTGYNIYHLPYVGNESLFSSAFTPVSEYYDQSGPMSDDLMVTDIGGDGVLDHLTFVPAWNEYNEIDSFELRVNGNSANTGDEYLEGFDYSPSIVCVNGSTYVYVEMSTVDDATFTYIFEITADSAEYKGCLDCRVYGIPFDDETGFSFGHPSEDRTYSMSLPTDPYHMYVRSNLYYLGNNSNYYSVDTFNNGIPATYQGWGIGAGSFVTANVDIDTLSHPDGQDATIPAGTRLLLGLNYGTTGTTVLVDPETGLRYFISVDNGASPHMITETGLSENETFSGIVYAA